MRPFACVLLTTSLLNLVAAHTFGAEHPLPKQQRDQLKKSLEKSIAEYSERIKADAKNVNLYSRRGDAYFFQGNFKQAVADYEKMVELDKSLDAKHWRRGIAYFYAVQYKKAAHQFEIYHSFDDVDRENGIWRFLSQTKAYGVKKARKGLLKYKKDDREPFPAVYQLFAGKITPEQILAQIKSAKINDNEREKRFFYAQLYIGLNFAVGKKPKLAAKHLRQAVANKWGPKSGFGPNYMWHVGRLHYELLIRSAKE